MKKALLTPFVLLFYYFLLSAQGGKNHPEQVWYFGNGAGLGFSSGHASPVFDSKLFTLEGCATVYDDQQQLLLYTDGITVWNKDHQVLKNGTGLNGSQSSTQAALIIAKPRTKGMYFLFTVDEKGGKKGLCYSVIDLTTGSGTVIKKNFLLLDLATEKLTVTKSANGEDFWVISHAWNSTAFHVFPVTAKGIGKPIISAVGSSHAETGAGENREAIGALCASPDGKKIASAICYRSKNNVEIFDFNNSTGVVSNVQSISFNGAPYGLCFSPNATKLYVSFLKGKAGIIQYDMIDKMIAEIVVGEKENLFGSLQVGQDGKIYIARVGNFLDAIELPNEKGSSCKYKQNAINLSPASCNYGLPNFLISTPSSSSLVENFTNHNQANNCSQILEKPFSAIGQTRIKEVSVCENSYSLSAKNPGAAYRWNNHSSDQQITVDSSGIYSVAISKQGCTLVDSIRVKFKKDLSVFRHLPAFNPDDSFINTEFFYSIEEVSDFKLTVFDRKKKKTLFETRNIDVRWNGKDSQGKLVPAGDYFWKTTYRPNCPKMSKPVVQEGKVQVKRKVSKK